MNNKGQSLGGIMATIIFILVLMLMFYWIYKYGYFDFEEQTLSYNELNGYEGAHPNICHYEESCLCRDKCGEIYGHSSWESWIYSKNGECWCIESNESRRIF